MNLKEHIRNIPDFPQEGVIFRDITPLLDNAEAFRSSVLQMSEPFKNAGIQKVAAIESRGFFFGPSVAIELGCGFVPVRKLGKLPWKTDRETYSLEYGSATIEVHNDAFTEGERVLLLDDVLADSKNSFVIVLSLILPISCSPIRTCSLITANSSCVPRCFACALLRVVKLSTFFYLIPCYNI
ncbi:hypothetical protein AGMMS49938_18940 [Fibrobacterales bacterium]|nr:hypothetical protein AGMMS49938_18940 [Fibrobacterales bacterium]